MRGDRLVAWCLVAALVCATGAHAASDELWRSAVQAEVDADPERAATLWLEVLGQPDLDENARVSATFRLGVVEHLRGNDGAARGHFAYVLERSPAFAVPGDTPAAARALFDGVRQARGAKATTAAPDTTTVAARALWIGGVAGGLVGVSSLAVGVIFATEAAAYGQQAMEADSPGERVRLTGLRDADIIYADVAFLVGAGLVVAGAGACAAAWAIEE